MTNLAKENIEIKKPFVALKPRYRKLYHQLAQELIDEGIFRPTDYLMLQQLCLNVQMFVEVNAKILSIDDCLETYKNGSNVSGLFTLWNKLQANILQIYPQLGIGFKARSRVTTLINNQLTLPYQEDPWHDLVTIDV